MSSSSSPILEPYVLASILGGFSGLIIAMFTIWNTLKKDKEQKQKDTLLEKAEDEKIWKENLKELEKDLKEHINLKAEITDGKINQINNKVQEHHTYFSDWIRRIERRRK